MPGGFAGFCRLVGPFLLRGYKSAIARGRLNAIDQRHDQDSLAVIGTGCGLMSFPGGAVPTVPTMDACRANSADDD
jgi:hypothetical protein